MKRILFIIIVVIYSCKNDVAEKKTNEEPNLIETKITSTQSDTIAKSRKHNFKDIICDLDGDNLKDSVQIVQSTVSKKYGLKISFGNKKTDYLGMGKDVINQGFNDFDWIGVFEKVDKGETYWSNVDEDGAIITDESEIKEEDKVKLQNDGIFVHQAESCGGGIIYLNGNSYGWIQQE